MGARRQHSDAMVLLPMALLVGTVGLCSCAATPRASVFSIEMRAVERPAWIATIDAEHRLVVTSKGVARERQMNQSESVEIRQSIGGLIEMHDRDCGKIVASGSTTHLMVRANGKVKQWRLRFVSPDEAATLSPECLHAIECAKLIRALSGDLLSEILSASRVQEKP